ncbi:hypothetical protein DFH09DRAFT_1154033 [Mycena vulgaris]|nr:hypothetical protein DFH09DRAFT_1154033 [Mycena vulgaris]
MSRQCLMGSIHPTRHGLTEISCSLHHECQRGSLCSKTIYSIVYQVKENKEELLRLSNRIKHVVLSLEDFRTRDIIQESEYTDAMTVISDVILRTERISQRLLKRSLGDRTWNRAEIASEISRLNEDLKNYLSVHTIRALDIMQSSQIRNYTALSTSIEEIAVKLAELDLRPSSSRWETRGQAWATQDRKSPMIMRGKPLHTITEHWGGYGDATLLEVKMDTSYNELLQFITNAAEQELKITVPQHLGQTIAEVDLSLGGIWAGVPTDGGSSLPPDLGQYPLLPISGLDPTQLPACMQGKGGFLMPMYRKEAMWISFNSASTSLGSAVKVSVGGVNTISGTVTKAITPLNVEQDYLVTGRQARLDGTVTGPGIVRQFVATTLGLGYTIEEQVTGKADEGGLQFDIFSPRPFGGLFQLKSPSKDLDDLKTPQELGIPTNSKLLFTSVTDLDAWCGITTKWTVGDYHHKTSRYDEPTLLPFNYSTPSTSTPYNRSHMWKVTEITQVSLTPSFWFNRTLLGLLYPSTPLHGTCTIGTTFNWFPLYDDPEAHVNQVSDSLARVKPVTQLDEERTGIAGYTGISSQNHCLAGPSRQQEVINFAQDRVSPLHIGPPAHYTSTPQNKQHRTQPHWALANQRKMF